MFDVHLCIVRPSYEEDDLDEIGRRIEIHSLGLEGKPTPLFRAELMYRLRRTMHAVRPHVLHTLNGIGWYTVASLPGAQGLARILEIHDSPQSGHISKLNSALERRMMRHLDYQIVVHSSHVRKQVAESFRVSPTRIAAFPLGIDTSRFSRPTMGRDEWRARNSVPLGTRIVLYVARLVRSKNLALFVDVAERVLCRTDRLLFAIAGTGPLHAELEALIASRGLSQKVRLLGFREDLVDIYHSSDVFLSTSHFEGFGLAVAEAMAAGRPVVSTMAGGVSDLIADGVTGFVCPVGDAESLSRATEILLNQPSIATKMGAESRRRAWQLFDVAPMVKSYEALYRHVAARN